ncbi:rab-GTPase-TBC domain-containing protein [Papiliotrema laurentii]|uniref:Rab-GTPase-TBC domain-containing protein n=1 Tax=Papiliotrema laurentii TaxID=5418 RepID=A0AAD9FWQ4_PAPLA|nr:rab-GTPase-TBC domain-containing protein [Papiliotrema laurentii]
MTRAEDIDQGKVYDKLLGRLSARYRTPEDTEDGLKRLRRDVFKYGLPQGDLREPLRPWIWKVFLRVDPVDKAYKNEYCGYVQRGPSPVSSKIKNDTFRTLATDSQFKDRVTEDMIIRLLEAFVWKNSDTGGDQAMPFSYVQGMNVLAAPFLYVMPSQIEAFACFAIFIERHCPLYVQPTMTGVHRGLALLDRCLEYADAELYFDLRSKNLTAELYAFPSVLTLCACTPPLNQVLKLWDFLLAYGVHLNILAVVAQAHMIREDLLASPSPMKILRQFPPFDAATVITIVKAMAVALPADLYQELACHPTGQIPPLR